MLLFYPTTFATSHNSGPSVYTPRFCPGSAVVDKTFYLVAGTIRVDYPAATADLLSVSLRNSFKADNVPWQRLTPTGYNVTDARVAISKDQTNLVLVGMGTTTSPLALVYNIILDHWSPVLAAAAGISPTSPRMDIGIVTDTNTGLMALYGGLVPNTSLSSELNILDASAATTSAWKWASASTTVIPRLFQPMMFYLSSQSVVLILGGCKEYVPQGSLTPPCESLSKGYLVTTGLVNGVAQSGIPSPVPITPSGGPASDPPPDRLSACNVLLPNGDIFIYGGAIFSGLNSLNDSWILHTKDTKDTKAWTWTPVPLNGAPGQGRAGATCQMVSTNLIMVVGGYDGPILGGNKHFTQPQIGFINTNDWTWTDTYDPPSKFGTGAIVGIAVGLVCLLGAAMFFLGRLYWRRRKLQLFPQKDSHRSDRNVDNRRHDSHSNFPLIASPFMDGSQDEPGRYGSPSTLSLNSKKIARSLPLIVMPLEVPSSSGSTQDLYTKSQRSVNIPSKLGAANNKPELIDLPESDRLSQNEADIQYGHYIRTLQHNKQYEKRRSSPLQRQPTHSSSSNQYVFKYGEEDDQDYSGMTSGIINLREIEVGEEFSSYATSSAKRKDNGTFIVSGVIEHLRNEDEKSMTGLGSKSGPGTPLGRPSYGQAFISASRPMANVKMAPVTVDKSEVIKDEIADDDDDDDEYGYVPGVGGPITALKAAREARAAAAAAATNVQRGTPPTPVTPAVNGTQAMKNAGGHSLESEATSLAESEVLIDNRTSRKTE
ncbi:hypothetical protein BGZ83_008199 [Gryganskiella cystojenkinii]|nr:hypothetical protein BGZ83_008199 [Gryganskiella cystojenkinii]